MAKVEIVEKIVEGSELTKTESTELVEQVFYAVKNTLETGETIEVSGSGKFIVKNIKEEITMSMKVEAKENRLSIEIDLEKPKP